MVWIEREPLQGSCGGDAKGKVEKVLRGIEEGASCVE